MKKQIKLIITAIVAVTMCSVLLAADGTRNTTTPGNWSDGGSWVGGVIPGAGDTANFTNDTAATVDTFVDVDTTIRNINVSDVGGATTNNYDVEPGAGFLTFAGGTTIDNATRFNLLCVTKGTEGFTKIGAGLMNIGKTSNLISGTVNLNGTGQVLLNHNQALMNADVSVATVLTSRKNEFNAKTITVANLGQLDMFQTDVPADPGTIIADSITVQSGGKLGNGYDPVSFTVGVPIKFVSPSVTVESGGEILVKTSMKTGGSTALPGISGSNIVVNSGGGINFGGANAVVGATFTISNPLTLSGLGAAASLGALITFGNGDNLTNDSDITIVGDTQIGQWGVGGYMAMNKPVTGTGKLSLHTQAASGNAHPKTFELNSVNTYNGNTKLSTFAASPTFEANVDQVFPNGELELLIIDHTPTLFYYDLNTYTQAVTQLTVTQTADDTNTIRGGIGAKIYSSGIIDLNNGVVDLSVPIEAPNQQFQVNSGTTLNLTNATVDVGLWGQLRPAWAGAAGATTTVNIDNGGKVICYSLRVADVNGTPIVNINSGGEIKCADVYVGNATALTGGKINIDDGILSDSTVGYIQTNWIWGFKGLDLTVDIKSGGATFDIANQYKSISEVITGVGNLTKTGGETLAFDVTPTLTGDINVNEGTVLFNTDVSGLAGSINLASGAAIGGTGTLPATTIPSGVTVTPGSSIGTLSFSGSVVMDAGSEYDWEVGDPVSADLIDVTGSFTIPGSPMTVNVIGAGVPDGSTYTLVQTTGGIIGDPANITMNYDAGVAGSAAYISGNDLVADVIPEPAALGLLAILGLAFLRRK